jgi:hypothetical protein
VTAEFGLKTTNAQDDGGVIVAQRIQDRLGDGDDTVRVRGKVRDHEVPAGRS